MKIVYTHSLFFQISIPVIDWIWYNVLSTELLIHDWQLLRNKSAYPFNISSNSKGSIGIACICDGLCWSCGWRVASILATTEFLNKWPSLNKMTKEYGLGHDNKSIVNNTSFVYFILFLAVTCDSYFLVNKGKKHTHLGWLGCKIDFLI